MPPTATTFATWVDGEQAAALPLPDRGLDFGDGLFETLLLAGGQPLFPELHMARLGRGLDVLGFPDCRQRVREQLAQTGQFVVDAGWRWAALRLTVTRGGGPRGYAAPRPCIPRLIATATELDRDCAQALPPATLMLSAVEMAAQPVLAGLKHLNRLEQVLAANEALAQGADEALMTTAGGAVVAVSAGNLFAVAAGRLLTPPIASCGIAGTRREKVLRDWAPALGIQAQEVTLAVRDIESADEVFYCNSLTGLRPVGRFGDRHWHDHPVFEALHGVYRGELP